MVSDEHYEMALPILQSASLEDEDKTDKLEDLFKAQTNLTGQSLDHAILDALWRYREGGVLSTSPAPIRQNILRRPSPASWRGSAGTPLSGSPRLGVSPLAPPGFLPSSFNRAKSSTASPFSSPRASPRLAFATPTIPHSPSLNAYEFASDSTPATEILGDMQAENVEWLVNDDAASISSTGTSSGLNAAAPEFSMGSQQADMSPYDMLRSILGQARTDDEIEAALAQNSYDLSATIVAMMDSQAQEGGGVSLTTTEEPRNISIGRPVSRGDARPTTPVNQSKSGIICKFYMSTGQCLRADCRFSHDLSNHLCK
jgi:hypothetical protein